MGSCYRCVSDLGKKVESMAYFVRHRGFATERGRAEYREESIVGNGRGGGWVAVRGTLLMARILDSLLRSEYFMRVVTDTSYHENGGRAIRESPLREVGRGDGHAATSVGVSPSTGSG